MGAKTVSSGNLTGIVVALLVLCAGVVVFFAIPVIGWVVGPILCILALGMGGKRQKVWRCYQCKYAVPRI